MNNKTELEKVKAEIESKKEEKEKYEKQLSQLKNQEKKLKKMASLEERKKRTHRLIVLSRGGYPHICRDGTSPENV